MTLEQALACIEQERLDVMAEGMTAEECDNVAAYVLANEVRRLLAAKRCLACGGHFDYVTILPADGQWEEVLPSRKEGSK